MKHLIYSLIIWAIIGAAYYIWETLNQLDYEALKDPGEMTPRWKIIAYGPFYWAIYLLLSAILRILS